MQAVRVQGIQLSLIKDKAGNGNWEVEKPARQAQSSASRPEQPEQQETNANADKKETRPIQLNIASVEVPRLAVSYEDQQTNTRYLVDEASLVTGPIRNQEPVDFQLQSRITIPDYIFRASISGLLTFNIRDGLYSISQLNISANPDVDKAETVSLVGGLNIEQTPLKVSGELDVTRFNPGNLLKQLKIQLPTMASETAMSSLSFDSQFVTDGKSFNASNLVLTLDEFKIDGQFQILDLQKQNIKFSFNGNNLILDNYLPPVGDKPATTTPSGDDKPQTGKTTKATPPPGKASTEQPLIPEKLIPEKLIPEDMLRGLNIDGSMKLSSLNHCQTAV